MRKSDGFSQISLHQRMLNDRRRTDAYQKAIAHTVKRGDVVLDLGCGSGILAFFAARQGCRKVYAIDQADIIEGAKAVARRNGFDRQIEFIKADIRSFQFKPKEPIDVLIHEQIGSFIWDEDLIAKVASIRSSVLKADAVVLPSRIEFYVAPTSYRSEAETLLALCRRRRYGIDFRDLAPMAFLQNLPRFIRPSVIELKDTATFLARPQRVQTTDLRTATGIPKRIAATFSIRKGACLTGLCGFFTVHLDDVHTFSTKPRRINTHWGQMFLPRFEETRIHRDARLHVTILQKRNPIHWRWTFEIEAC